MRRLDVLEARMLAAPDQQISLTDPDSRSMATSGRGSGVVGYNVQVAVDTERHLIVAHEVTNTRRWEHEQVLKAVQKRLDENPQAMRRRRETVEHPFGTIKARMGATHFLMKTLPRVAAEMALHVLAYSLTRVLNIVGSGRLMAAIQA
jgi:hypothetical protein